MAQEHPPPAEMSFAGANCAQFSVNFLFGIAAIASALSLSGVHAVHPVAFGFVRAAITTVVLAAVGGPSRVRAAMTRSDSKRFAAAAFFLFVAEFFVILGIRFAGSIRAAVWQPTQPIWTTAITACLGHERLTARRASGVAIASAGCVAMVLLGARAGKTASTDPMTRLMGDICLFLNCSLGTPCYLIAVKPLLARHAAVPVAALTFFLNSGLFGAAYLLSLAVPDQVPAPLASWDWVAIGGCLYVAFLATALPYVLQLRATKRLPASLVSAYYVLQPVVTSIAVYVCRALGVRGLAPGSPSDLFAVAVIAGLALVVWDAKKTDAAPSTPDAETGAELLERRSDRDVVV